MADSLNGKIHVLQGGNERITAYYGLRRDPVTGKTRTAHQGIDLISGIGNRTVTAFADGVVTSLRNTYTGRTTDGSAGNYLTVTHTGGTKTMYKHLKKDSLLVKKGDPVKAGQPMATMGDTGHATGVHLHFDVVLNGKRVDPLPYLRGEKSLPGMPRQLNGNRGNDPALRFGAKPNADVRAFQQLMQKAGRYSGPADGVAGRYTLRAAKGYTVGYRTDGEVPRWVQRRLRTMGYYTGLVDGKPRRLTESAIRTFERDFGLTEDGKVTDNDWYYLLAVE